MMQSLSERIAAHAASAPARACGWLVGTTEPVAAPFGLVRCVRSSADGLPEWEVEAAELSKYVPCGMNVIGWYVVGWDAEELSVLVKTHAVSLSRVLAGSSDVIFATGSTANVAFFRCTALAGGALEPIEAPPPAEVALAALHETHILLRARPTVHLQVRYRDGADGGSEWAVAHGAASAAAHEQLRSERTCFAFPQARHLGVVSLATSASRPAPFATGPCGALDDRNGAAAGQDSEADGDSSGKKGGGKKSGGKGKTGGGGGALGAVAPASTGDAGPAAAPGTPMTVQMLWPQCIPPNGSLGGRHPAPTLSIEPCGPYPTSSMALPLQLDALVYVSRALPLADALSCLQSALVAQLDVLSAAHLAAAPSAAAAQAVRATVCVFRPAELMLMHTQMYVLPLAGEATEPSTREQRVAAHRRLGLPLDRPLLRTCNAIGLGSSAGGTGGTGTPIPGILRDVHLGLSPPALKNAQVALVQGTYEYFHYMQWTGHGQDGYRKPYDDCGWGCAYRSLMSIISWFRLQGYTTLPNPTHLEIQKTLVEHCGQVRTSDRLLMTFDCLKDL